MASSARIQTKDAWENFFKDSGIPQEDAKKYAQKFHDNRITCPEDIDKEVLKQLKIDIVGDQIAIMKKIKSMKTTSEREHQPNYYEKPNSNTSFKTQVNLPRIESEMTNAGFRKLKTDWEVYKSIVQIPESQIISQIYTACDSSLQSTIINTIPEFLTLKESELLQKIENIVTCKTNPAVHRLNFRSLNQSEGEQTKNFLVRLKTTAKDCMFECPACKHDLSEMNIRDQLIRGLSNQSLQTDILAKADKLTDLDSIIRHAEAFEGALRDQAELSKPAEAMRLSQYKKAAHHRNHDVPKPFNRNNSYQKNPNPPRQFSTKDNYRDRCIGCGSSDHSSDNLEERRKKCPAWGKQCSICKGINHFASVCFYKRRQRARINEIQTEDYDNYEDDDEDNIVAHVHLVENIYTTVAAVTIQQIPATLTPIHPNGKPTETLIFPDSGASICLASPKHLKSLGINKKDLTPTNK